MRSNRDVLGKIALFCDVEQDAVIPLVTADTIYAVPLSLEDAGLGDWIVEHLELTTTRPAAEGLADWRNFVAEARREKPVLNIGLVGKYVELEDAYFSVKEALFHAGLAVGRDIKIQWISSEDLERGRDLARLGQAGRHRCPRWIRLSRHRRQDRGRTVCTRGTRCPTWGSAWACRCCASNLRATCLTATNPTAPNSTSAPNIRSST